MPRKRLYVESRIDSVHSRIALWELMGRDFEANGLRLFFSGVIDENDIERHKKEFATSNDELAANYTPKTIAPPPRRKTGLYREKKTLTQNGVKYEYIYNMIYKDGKLIKTLKMKNEAEQFCKDHDISF